MASEATPLIRSNTSDTALYSLQKRKEKQLQSADFKFSGIAEWGQIYFANFHLIIQTCCLGVF